MMFMHGIAKKTSRHSCVVVIYACVVDRSNRTLSYIIHIGVVCHVTCRFEQPDVFHSITYHITIIVDEHIWNNAETCANKSGHVFGPARAPVVDMNCLIRCQSDVSWDYVRQVVV